MPTPCPGCNKFPSLSIGDPEADDFIINEDGTISGTVRVVLITDCCDEEMKEYTFEVDYEMGKDFDGHLKPLDQAKDGEPPTIAGANVEVSPTVDEIKLKGKKAFRLTAEITVSGDALKEPVVASWTGDVLQSEMDEMV